MKSEPRERNLEHVKKEASLKKFLVYRRIVAGRPETRNV